jgi:hypothetical protein
MDLRQWRSPVSAPRYTLHVHARCRLMPIMRNLREIQR